MFAKVYLEITNVCNLNCSFCIGTSRRKKFLSREEFDVLVEKIRPYTEFLYFHILGEPLLHPDLQYFFEKADKLGFKVIITTNGTLLKDKAEILLNSPALFKINISLHSFEANSGNDENSYFSNCFDFADISSKKGIITVFRLWNDGGENTYNDMIFSKLKERFGNAFAENTKGYRIRKKLFIELDKKFDWPLTSNISTDKITCFGIKDHIGILCDGRVVPCCLDYNGNISFGNLFESSLVDILETDIAVNFKNTLSSGIAPCEMCKKCGFAQKKFLHI